MKQTTTDHVVQRKVHFAEHEDIFIIREDDDDQISILGLSNSEIDAKGSVSSASTAAAAAQQEPDENEEADEEASFQDSIVDIQKNVRDCVYKWFNTPYWKLLEGSVDDEDGEAKDVQKYITSFARVEIDDDIPRGLERQLCRGHHEARKALAECATHAVLSNDFRLRYETGGTNLSDDDIWKELRHIYKEHSRGAKAFARKVGKADEAAVQRDTLEEEQALELIEELQERTKAGAIRVKRCSSMTEVQLRRSSKEKEHGSPTKSNSSSSSSRRSRSSSSSSMTDPLSGDSDHTTSSFTISPKKDKSGGGGKRRTPFRVPSMPSMKTKDRNDSNSKEPSNDGSHVEDLFHEVDKKGKTKRSSRWRSLKKRISKRVHGERNPRTQ